MLVFIDYRIIDHYHLKGACMKLFDVIVVLFCLVSAHLYPNPAYYLPINITRLKEHDPNYVLEALSQDTFCQLSGDAHDQTACFARLCDFGLAKSSTQTLTQVFESPKFLRSQWLTDLLRDFERYYNLCNRFAATKLMGLA